MAEPIIIPSFASGEWAPKLRSRVDIQKYRSGAALLRNFFVDYSGGGASTRQGTKFIAQVGALGARLVAFQASTTIGYVLEFGQNYIRFYNNGAQITSGGNPYQITTPYNASDLFPNQATGNPGLKFAQDANSLIICHPNYVPYILTVNSATNWTLNAISFGPTIQPPTSLNGTGSSLTSGDWNYAYTVTSVDSNGQESQIATPLTFSNLDWLGNTVGMLIINWTAATGAASYNVYKAAPSYSVAVPDGAQWGFIGNVTGTSFTDSYPGIDQDYSQGPPILQNPFSGASVQSLTLTANATYTSVPAVTIAAPSSGIQATAYISLQVETATIATDIVMTVSDNNANFAGQLFSAANGLVFAISTWSVSFGLVEITGITIVTKGSITSGSAPSSISYTQLSNINISGFESFNTQGTIDLTWDIGSLILIQGGEGYISTPSVTISGSATATATLGPSSYGNPGVPSFFQERLVLAGQQQDVQGYQMSQPGSFFNFNISNPSEDDDAISGTIISDELNDIRWLIPVPTGIIAGTGKGAWTINGGGGISTLNPITPANQVASPQAFNGANDLKPQKVNFDVIYGTNKGGYFRDLTYNIYANIFTGSDITTLSNHLFFNHYFLDLAWSEEPFKTMWFVRDDGILLSLAFVKEQELIGWAHHDTNGQFKSVCSVIETVGPVGVTFGDVVDAIYVIVERTINGSVVQYVERMADRYFPFGCEDSWSVDCGLQTSPQSTLTGQLVISGNASVVGNSVTLTDTADAPFTSAMATNNWIVRANGGIYKITTYTSTSVVTATVVRVPQQLNPYTSAAFNVNNGWTIWEPVTTVTGLTQLEGESVVGVADGVAIGPLTVSGSGGVTLPSSASKVTLGLQFTPQLRTLSLDIGEPTAQGKRKRISAMILRVADTLGLQVGTTFSTLVTMKDFQLGAIPSTSTGPSIVIDLVNPSWAPDQPVIDGLQLSDPLWQENGQLCIEQNLPYPATITGIIPTIDLGDTPR